ncbi:xanthine dehydrogenase family protein subunit M [Streptosporangium sp. NPDC051022]|uniref:FAD binding domain-containing protein n=1 Tax=Streptosporangium sp. NPDC051022 TaxID=3155752 RepID=UPI003430596E
MKPPPFAYHRPASLGEALDVLHRTGGEGKVLAGGQSLVPILNMRLAAPAHLVDVNHVPGLDRIQAGPDGVRVGATVRHAALEHDAEAYASVPLLRRAVVNVAHPTIRNRGTTVGSLVHADPSGEMTAVLALLEGTVELASRDGGRTVTAGEFFTGPLESCLEAGEMAVSAWFPRPAGRTGSAFAEAARRHGDYAMCGVGALVTLDDGLRVTRARAAYLSVSPTPLVLDLTDAVAGRPYRTADWAAAGRLARDLTDPEEDIHATAAYRRHLVGVLTGRVLAEAATDAAEREEP